jgi:hypothetical protein
MVKPRRCIDIECGKSFTPLVHNERFCAECKAKRQPKILPCAVCGKNYTRGESQSPKFCGTKCRDKRTADKAAAVRERTIRTRLCSECKSPFTVRNNAKTCSEVCSKARTSRYQKAHKKGETLRDNGLPPPMFDDSVDGWEYEDTPRRKRLRELFELFNPYHFERPTW